MSAYLKSDFEDAELYAQNLVSALTTFPAVIVATLADPRTGIVRTSKWPPRVAEAVEWCEAEMAKRDAPLIAERERREREAEREAALRRAEAESIPPEETARRQRVIEQLQARCGPNWGLDATGALSPHRVHSPQASVHLRGKYPDRIVRRL